MHGQTEMVLGCVGLHADRSIGFAVGTRIGQQVGQQLRHALAVADHRHRDGEVRLDIRTCPGQAHFLHDLLQFLGQRLVGIQRHGNAPAQPPAREIQHIVDQVDHASHALLDARRVAPGAFAQRLHLQQFGGHADGLQGIAQVVAQHGDELVAQFCRHTGIVQVRFGPFGAFLHFQLRADQLAEQVQCLDHLLVLEHGRVRIDRAQGAEQGAVSAEDRYRNVALEAVQLGRGVVAEPGMDAGVAEDHRLVAMADLIADGFQYQFAAGASEVPLFVHGARHLVSGHPRQRAQSVRFAPLPGAAVRLQTPYAATLRQSNPLPVLATHPSHGPYRVDFSPNRALPHSGKAGFVHPIGRRPQRMPGAADMD